MASHMAGPSENLTSATPKPESKKPKYTRFTQQELAACKPLLTPNWVIATFFIVGIIFIPIGAASLAASNGVVEIVQRYEDECIPSATTNDQREAYVQSATTNKNCTITLRAPHNMKPPIYVYYQLNNYYQNHRRYVKSRSDAQLRGDNNPSLSACKPEDYLGKDKTLPINPCGLAAWSYFNDTYAFSIGGRNLTIDERYISWKSDRDDKFSSDKPQNFNTIPALRGGGTLAPDVPLDHQEHLIVWMRTAALPAFRKLWGRIHEELPAGTQISVNILNQYNTYSFNGQKKLVLSTASWLGGKNDFLGIAYITVGSICIGLALLFLALHLISPRQLGDVNYLSWNRKSGPNQGLAGNR
eukprot:SM000228S07389  [mRNA]  locus=s228:118459:121028:- [translate_table: standard]